MKNEQFREHADRVLSALTWTEEMRDRVLRSMEKREGKPMKKLSAGLVIVLALMLATTAVALATGGFGILQYMMRHAPEKTENQAYVNTILTVGQTYECDAFTLSLNETAFDGMRLTAAMELYPKAGADPVFVLPGVRATVNGEAAEVSWLGGSYDDAGFWAPDLSRMVTYDACGGAEIVLARPADGPVNWEIVYEIYQPLLPIVFTVEDEPGIGEEEWTDAQYAFHEQQFADAYRDGKIMLDQYADPWWYLACIPQQDGIDGGEKEAKDVWQNAVDLGVFRRVDQAVFRFETRPASVYTVENRPLLTLPEGEKVTLEKMDVLVDAVSLRLRISREDGAPAAEDDGSWRWSFAVLAEGAETKWYGGNCRLEEDGSILYEADVSLSRPTDRVYIVPCREEDGILMGNPATREVYRRQEAVTEEEKNMTAAVDLE
ncbi:MAG: hypothetical protein K5919_00495 [Clostridiales bacterium]|nr:hypothetical protein [Clostridiales bacterium]